MAKKLSTHFAQLNTNAAASASAMAGGTSTAEAQGIAEILKVMGQRPDLAAPILRLCDPTKTLPEWG